MNSYHIRLDSLNMEEIQLKVLKGIKRCLIGVERKKGNPHTHMYVECDNKPSGLRNRIKTMSDYKKGNGYYSVKVLEDQNDSFMKMKGYVCKDGELTTVGFSEEELETIRAYNASVKEEMKLKKKRKTRLEDMEEKFVLVNPDGCRLSTEQVIDQVIDYYKKEGLLVRKFMMVSQVQTLCLKYDAVGYRYMLKRDLMNSLVPFGC